jgi:ABC-type dipeptide/oligopeptide/nickel transport system permease component
MALLGDYPAPPAYIAQIRHEFGLDQPLWTQLWVYFVNLAHGQLGFLYRRAWRHGSFDMSIHTPTATTLSSRLAPWQISAGVTRWTRRRLERQD